MKRIPIAQQLAGAIAVAAMLAFTPAAQAQTILKFSHTDQPGGARQKAAELFAQKVEQYTQGRYKVQVYPAGQLANDPKGVEQLQLGGIDFTVTGTGTYATHIPTLNLTALPFLIESYEQGWKLYDDSKWMQAQFAKGPDKGFRFLSTFEAGFRSMTTKKPLVTPAVANLPDRQRCAAVSHAPAQQRNRDGGSGTEEHPGRTGRHVAADIEQLLQRVRHARTDCGSRADGVATPHTIPPRGSPWLPRPDRSSLAEQGERRGIAL